MDNFLKNDTEKNSTNPFSDKIENLSRPVENNEKSTMPVKRLNITDMEVLNAQTTDSETEFLEMKMNNLYQIIHQQPQNLDPIALEKVKMEWEDLRDKLYNLKKSNKNGSKIQKSGYSFFNCIKFLSRGFSNLLKLFKIHSPKIRKIMDNFNEINKEVEDLVCKATPKGEEELKYGLLVNKIYQATKLNEKLTSEIK